jgi:hypothetical protein
MLFLVLRFTCKSAKNKRADERTRTADLISLRVITQALQGVANPVYVRRFLFSRLLSVAPYCVPSGIRVVSIASSYSSDTIVRRRPVRFNL